MATYTKEIVTKVEIIRKDPLNIRSYPKAASETLYFTTEELNKAGKRAGRELRDGIYYVVSTPKNILYMFTRGEIKRIKRTQKYRKKSRKK